MTTMKKRSICGLMAAMLLLTTACGGSKESSTEQKDAPQTEGAEAELTEWDQSVVYQLVEKVTVLAKDKIRVTFRNGTEVEQEIEQLDWRNAS